MNGYLLVDNMQKQHNLISVLLDIQGKFNYLPEQELEKIAQELNIPIAQIYSLATFYGAFSLEPKGKHIIRVCMGTACHVRGGQRILDRLKQMLEIDSEETTSDNLFTLETVNCLGACALGPLVVIDGKYYGKITTTKIEKVLKEYKREK